MVNVGNGNLIVQATDIDIPERGIDLAFRRTYNSKSAHDYNNTDQSVASSFGDGWTNTLDAHLVYTNAQTLTLYDIDGSRYDFTGSDAAGWTPPPGEHASLQTLSVNGANCYYQWTKPNGTAYVFFRPDYAAKSCYDAQNDGQALNGRLFQIWARNHNNSIQLNYYFDTAGANSANQLTEIDAVHSDGQSLILKFADQSGRRELALLQTPDGQQINYYVVDGILAEVTKPPNASSNGSVLPEEYTYGANYRLLTAESPRYVLSSNYGSASAQEGNVTNFLYDCSSSCSPTTGNVTTEYDWGVMNVQPGAGPFVSDGVNQSVEGSSVPANAPFTWHTENYSGWGSGSTSYVDSDGHATTWTLDAFRRVVQTAYATGNDSLAVGTSSNISWLVTNNVWDTNSETETNNELTETTNAAGDTTDYAYDAHGNIIAVAGPLESASGMMLRPTSLYSYDGNNNLTSYCDPAAVGAAGYDWSNRPVTENACALGTRSTRLTWTTSPYEPFGELASITTPGTAAAPGGYMRTYVYAAASQGAGSADYGLATRVLGSPYTQVDGSTASPEKDYVYDDHGNLVCQSSYVDGNKYHWAIAQYDVMNRTIAASDADDAALSQGNAAVQPACSKEPGIAGSYITTTSTYNADGSLATSQGPSEHALNVADTSAYDADGNVVSATSYKGGIQSTTLYYYDGADRLVEVAQPHDARTMPSGKTFDYYAYGFLTRYLYDLSGASGKPTPQNFYGAAVSAFGNKWATEQYVGSQTTGNWTLTTATSYDAVDRKTIDLHTKVCPASTSDGPNFCSPVVTEAYTTYDENGNYGSPTTFQNANGDKSFTAYDHGRIASRTFSDGTPSRQYTYDPAGHVTQITSSLYGLETNAYDDAGELASTSEASAGGLSDPSTISYTYNPDGTRSAISAKSNGNTLFSETFAHRSDGATTYESLAYGSSTFIVNKQYTVAGRLTSMTSGSSQQQITYDAEGRASSDSFGASSETGMTYDANGELTGGTVNQPGVQATQVTNYYNMHGELANSGGGYAQSANGVLIHNNGNATNWDPLNGVVLGAQVAGSLTIGYDTAGRQTGDSNVRESQFIDANGDQCPTNMRNVSSVSRSYDVENHNVQTTRSSSSQQPVNGSCTYTTNNSPTEQETYGWGPNGHPVAISWAEPNVTPEPSGVETLHWDGNSLLFTSNASSLGRIFLGDDGYFAVGGTQFVLSPRDIAGAAFTACAVGSGDYFSCPSSSPDAFPGVNSSISDFAIYKNRLDGIATSNDVIQGTRSYNPDTLSWTTPDAYPAEPANPLSQQRYVWNDNNPIAYSDPSGYKHMRPMGGGDGDFFPTDEELSLGPNGPGPNDLQLAANIAAILTISAYGKFDPNDPQVLMRLARYMDQALMSLETEYHFDSTGWAMNIDRHTHTVTVSYGNSSFSDTLTGPGQIVASSTYNGYLNSSKTVFTFEGDGWPGPSQIHAQQFFHPNVWFDVLPDFDGFENKPLQDVWDEYCFYVARGACH